MEKKSNSVKFLNYEKLIIYFLLLFFIFLLLSGNSLAIEIDDNLKISAEALTDLEQLTVNWIYDGDTVRTSCGENIRFIGIDTQEMNWKIDQPEFFAQEALDFTREKLLDQKVYLKYDRSKRDHYNRLLGYLFLEDGTFFNGLLLQKGFAHIYTVPPDEKYADFFKELVMEARKERTGLWNKIFIRKKDLPVIHYDNAEEYLNQQVIVKGEIISTYQAEKAVFLNFHEKFYDNLSIVIYSFNLNKFAFNPAEYLQGKKIKVMGEISLYNETPQIIVNDPYQIMVIEE